MNVQVQGSNQQEKKAKQYKITTNPR